MFRSVKKICLKYLDTNENFNDATLDEKLICFLLIIIIVTIGVFPDFFLNFIQGESSKIILGI